MPWRFLGPPARSFPAIRAYLQQLQKLHAGTEVVYKEDRLDYIELLGPTAIYEGLDELDGYYAFYFQQYRAAVLECAKVGNAIFVIYGSWLHLAKKSKAELNQEKTGSVYRIEHRGDWKKRLEDALHQGRNTKV